jgi:hypothetical protein
LFQRGWAFAERLGGLCLSILVWVFIKNLAEYLPR